MSNRNFRVKINISLEIMNKIFDFSKDYAYELRCGNSLSRSNIQSTHFGIQSIVDIAAKIWNKISNDFKEASFVTVFKSKTKKWLPQGYSCRLCKTYVGQVCFI